MTCVYNLYKTYFQLLIARVKHKSEPQLGTQLRRTPFLVYYLLSHNYTLKVQTLSQVCLGLKIDFRKLKLRLKFPLTCQTVSFGHLHFSSV